MEWIHKRLNSPAGCWHIDAAGPSAGRDSLRRLSMILVLKENDGESNADFLKRYHLLPVIEQGETIVVFPVCRNETWVCGDGEALSADEHMAVSLLNQGGGLTSPWFPSADLHYMIGQDSGADLVCAVVSRCPSFACAAGVCAIGGKREMPPERPAYPIPAMLCNMPQSVVHWFCRGCGTDVQSDRRCFSNDNPAQTVCLRTPKNFESEDVWQELFCHVRRLNTSAAGDAVMRQALPNNAVLCRDVLLGDGLRHTWIEVPPKDLDSGKKMPLVLVSHGMGDKPYGVAEQCGMHLVGQEAGFLTVYPAASNGIRWNLTEDKALPDDMAYYDALIDHLSEKYPIDQGRIYTSGFSNGAGMAMMYALTHPERIAASCPIDSTFPYATTTRFRPPQAEAWLVPEEGLKPMILPPSDREAAMSPLKRALEKQAERAHPLRLPVMYFYGTRESEYPIRTDANQQLSADFWRAFNGISPRTTDDTLTGEDAVGAVGDEVIPRTPDRRWPAHRFTEHVFFNEDGLDAYHFVLMHGKAHDVHPAEARLGWAYVSRFTRLPDGSLLDGKGGAEG